PTQESSPRGGLYALSPEEFQSYRQILVEPNLDRKLGLLADFEKKYPKSAASDQVLTAMMNIYVMKGEAAKATEYGEKVIRLDPNNVTALIQVSRNYTILQTNPPKALEYANRAATIAARLKTQSPSLDSSAQANLVWVKKSAAWQQQQFLSL